MRFCRGIPDSLRWSEPGAKCIITQRRSNPGSFLMEPAASLLAVSQGANFSLSLHCFTIMQRRIGALCDGASKPALLQQASHIPLLRRWQHNTKCVRLGPWRGPTSGTALCPGVKGCSSAHRPLCSWKSTCSPSPVSLQVGRTLERHCPNLREQNFYGSK